MILNCLPNYAQNQQSLFLCQQPLTPTEPSHNAPKIVSAGEKSKPKHVNSALRCSQASTFSRAQHVAISWVQVHQKSWKRCQLPFCIPTQVRKQTTPTCGSRFTFIGHGERGVCCFTVGDMISHGSIFLQISCLKGKGKGKRENTFFFFWDPWQQSV